MPSHLNAIADRIEIIIRDELLPELVTDSLLASGDVPQVRKSKRYDASGRGKDPIRIREGITIVPVKDDMAGGTNERDDTRFIFYVTIGYGSHTDELESDWPLANVAEGIRQRFNQTRINATLDRGCEVATTLGHPSELPEKMELEEGIDVTIFRVNVFVREIRRRYV